MELGVERGTVQIVPYQQGWREAYLREKTLLETLFGKQALVFEHVGSTAVEGLMAKPIIDIAVQVPSIEVVQGFENGLRAMGYRERINRLEGPQRVFGKEHNNWVTHNLHLIQVGYQEWNRKILFRDYLRNHPQVRQEYEELKMRILSLFQAMDGTGGTYNDQKQEFIISVVVKAEQEAKQRT
ncbi:GrpB family protein [Rhodocytophaga aerolata]|uniref:GrpB family protein n=1 Tax=Rhodocytophaga aerolata TaxID=455078 RepID=A0ABT8RIL4_9BACT|nr:GrpB family protein [Rhodocytophaga aerolata]MDO1451938.1 GrpB family protein [Rhodocytophaga aerolata]